MKRKDCVRCVVVQTALRHWILALGIAVTVAGAVGASLIPPLVLGEIVDRLTEGRGAGWGMVLGYFGWIALTGVLESSRESLLIVFGQKITHALRRRMCEQMRRMTAEQLSAQEPGAVVSRFVGDVNTVETLFTSGIISMFADGCKIISILAIIWAKNRGLALVLLMLMPLIFAFTRCVQKRMLSAQLANRRAVERVTNHVPESLRCIRTIHALGKERYMEGRYDGYIGQSYAAIEKTNFCDSIYSPAILILNAVIVAAVMLLSASNDARVLTFFGMSAGTAVAVIHYIGQVFAPLESLGMEIQTLQSAVAGVNRIDEFLKQPCRWETDAHAKPREGAPCMEMEGVTFGYDHRDVLRDLSFSVERGEKVTLCGRTGAGKSTVFKLILGLYRPRKGRVRVAGMDASAIPDEKKRGIFGYVEQSMHLVPGTVMDQITLFDSSIPPEMAREAAKLVGLHETIEALERGYDTPCTPSLFSQGQWQLLSIARAAAGRPRILLLDEMTANLDAETEAMVLEALSRVSEERTVLSISHRIYQHTGGRRIEIENFCGEP